MNYTRHSLMAKLSEDVRELTEVASHCDILSNRELREYQEKVEEQCTFMRHLKSRVNILDREIRLYSSLLHAERKSRGNYSDNDSSNIFEDVEREENRRQWETPGAFTSRDPEVQQLIDEVTSSSSEEEV